MKLKLIGVPEHVMLLRVKNGVAEIVAVKGTEPVLTEVNVGIRSVPFAASPIEGRLFCH